METVSETTVYLDLREGRYEGVTYRDCEIVLVGVSNVNSFGSIMDAFAKSGRVKSCTFTDCLFVGEAAWQYLGAVAREAIERARA